MKFYRDQIAIVTGAASGIGLALSRQLASSGARVTLVDVGEGALESAIDELSHDGLKVDSAVLDVCDREAVEQLVKSVVNQHGRLDYLFSNAGIGVGGEARDYEATDWSRVIDVNLMGVVNGVSAAYPVMVAQGHGHIVNTGSVAGLIPLAGELSYVTSKYAVVGLSHALRAEAAALGVKVSVACPGKIETPIYDTSRIIKFDKDAVLAMWPQGVSAERCATLILKGVRNNQSTIVVTRIAKALWAVGRVSPDAVIWAMKRYMKEMRKHRIED